MNVIEKADAAIKNRLTQEEAAAVHRALFTMSLPMADYALLRSAIRKLEKQARPE